MCSLILDLCTWSLVHRDTQIAVGFCKYTVTRHKGSGRFMFSGGKRCLSSIFTCESLSWSHSLASLIHATQCLSLLPHPHSPICQAGVPGSLAATSGLSTKHSSLSQTCNTYRPVLISFAPSLSHHMICFFPHLRSAAFSKEFLYWARPVFILSSVCPSPQSSP